MGDMADDWSPGGMCTEAGDEKELMEAGCQKTEEMQQVGIIEGNRRKGKVVYCLWLDKNEEKIMLESLNKGISSVAWTIIKKAYDCGDFKR